MARAKYVNGQGSKVSRVRKLIASEGLENTPSGEIFKRIKGRIKGLLVTDVYYVRCRQNKESGSQRGELKSGLDRILFVKQISEKVGGLAELQRLVAVIEKVRK
jgi:hypothetical protein